MVPKFSGRAGSLSNQSLSASASRFRWDFDNQEGYGGLTTGKFEDSLTSGSKKFGCWREGS